MYIRQEFSQCTNPLDTLPFRMNGTWNRGMKYLIELVDSYELSWICSHVRVYDIIPVLLESVKARLIQWLGSMSGVR